MTGIEEFDAYELLALARHDVEKERLDHGLGKLKHALHVKECPPIVFAELGRLYAKLKLFEKASASFETYLTSEPGALNERFQLGMAYLDAGDSNRAQLVWDGLLKDVPLHPPALFFTALTLANSQEWAAAHQRCSLILDNVTADNLYHGRAKDLIERMERDPEYRESGNGSGPTVEKRKARKEH